MFEIRHSCRNMMLHELLHLYSSMHKKGGGIDVADWRATFMKTEPFHISHGQADAVTGIARNAFAQSNRSIIVFIFAHKYLLGDSLSWIQRENYFGITLRELNDV